MAMASATPATPTRTVTASSTSKTTASTSTTRCSSTATATIRVAEVADALQVPNAALRYAPPQAADDRGGGSGLLGLIMPRRPGSNGGGTASGRAVWVLRDGTPEEEAVETGQSDGKRTVILSGGLVEGDEVITDRIEAK